MKLITATITALTLSAGVSRGETVYVTDREAWADTTVFITNVQGFADKVVYITKTAAWASPRGCLD